MDFRYQFDKVPISLVGGDNTSRDCYMTGSVVVSYFIKDMKPLIHTKSEIDVTMRDVGGILMYASVSERHPLYSQIYGVIEEDLNGKLKKRFDAED